MNRLSTALSLALIGTTSHAVQLTWAGDAANSDCACAQAASDPCCNQGGNNVDIALNFDVDVKRSAATVVAAAAAAPAQETATDNTEDNNTTPAEDNTPDPTPVDPNLLTTGPISLGNDTPIGNGLVWSVVRGDALSDPDAFRLTDTYTGATAKDRAIMDALIASSNASGSIPSGTQIDISYTVADGISTESVEAATAVSTSSS